MDRTPSPTGLRLSALAVALLAITFNLLQPLIHAAAMRDGAPDKVWGVFCRATAADPGGKQEPVPASAASHDCCLGLAHAAPMVVPSSTVAILSPVVTALAPSLPRESLSSVGARDGPHRPRGPPSIV